MTARWWNVNEEGEAYDSHPTEAQALLVQAEYPNDRVVQASSAAEAERLAFPTADPFDLQTLDRLTDAEADNVRTAIRQGDLPEEAWPITWATVVDSVRQMPDEVLAHYGDPGDLQGALDRVVAAVGEETDVLATYKIHGYQ